MFTLNIIFYGLIRRLIYGLFFMKNYPRCGGDNTIFSNDKRVVKKYFSFVSRKTEVGKNQTCSRRKQTNVKHHLQNQHCFYYWICGLSTSKIQIWMNAWLRTFGRNLRLQINLSMHIRRVLHNVNGSIELMWENWIHGQQ